MQTVRDYTKKEEFKVNVETKLKPKLDLKLEEIWKKQNFSKIKIYKIFILISFIIFILLLVMAIVWNFNVVALSLAIISFVLTLAFVVVWIAHKNKIKDNISQSINFNKLYKAAFDLLNANIEFIDTRTPNNKIFPIIDKKESSLFNALVAQDFRIDKITNLEHLLLHSKHYATFSSVVWKKEIKDPKTKEVRVIYAYTTVIKIDTRGLRDNFQFSMEKSTLFNFSSFSKGKKIKLENSDFNKEFNFSSFNELRSFLMLTPLAMEIMVERKRDKSNVDAKDIKILSTGNYLYIGFINQKANPFPKTVPNLTMDVNEMSERIIKQTIDAVYNIYYGISIMQIPIYLD